MDVQIINDGKFKYIFLNDPDNMYTELNPLFNITLNKVNAENLRRYVTKLYYDGKISNIDYNKQIKIILEEYLKNNITEKDLKEIEKMKAGEAKQIERARKKEIPKFDWDLANRKEKKWGFYYYTIETFFQ